MIQVTSERTLRNPPDPDVIGSRLPVGRKSLSTSDGAEQPQTQHKSPEPSSNLASRNTSQGHVVILVHGIRDFALWQTTVRSAVEDEGLKAEAINYGRINLLQFLAPFSYFRKKAIATVWNQIRIVKQNNEGSLLSVIAHSFGTFVIAHLVQENFDVKFHRIIFCGSVVPYGFPFEQFQNRFTQPIINEVGTRDIWPALAESITFGYGSAGTYGFRRPLVRDRWHNGAHHGFFLDAQFCIKFWSPFLRDGEIVSGARDPESPPRWLQLFSVFKIKYVLVALTLAYLINFVSNTTNFRILDFPTPSNTKSLTEPVNADPQNEWTATKAVPQTISPASEFPTLLGKNVKVIYSKSDSKRMDDSKNILTQAGAIVHPEPWLAEQMPVTPVIKYANDRQPEAMVIRDRLRPHLGEFKLEVLDRVGEIDIQVYLGQRATPQ
jgi:hypothetical protein